MTGLPVIEDPRACGIGQGARCCSYLVVGGAFECGRADDGLRSAIEARVAAGTFTAIRQPTEEFPACQLTSEGDAA